MGRRQQKDVRSYYYESGFIVSSNSDVDMAFSAIRNKLTDLGYLGCEDDNVIDSPIVDYLNARAKFYFKPYGKKILVGVLGS